MVKLVTGTLYAHSMVRNNSGTEPVELDFTVRAPIGIVINRVTSQLMLNDVAGLASSEQEANAQLILDPDETSTATAWTETANSNLFNSNTKVILVHGFMFDGDQSSGLANAGQQHAPILDLNFANQEVQDRPITFQPLTHILRTLVGVEMASLISIQYQLAEFTNDEIAVIAAGTF